MRRGLLLTLPLPPNMANGTLAKAHWATKRRAQQRYAAEALVALQNQRKAWRGAHRPPHDRPIRVTATLYLYHRMDQDNLAARLKWALDALVRAGVLADDDPAHLALTVRQVVDRADQRVEFTMDWPATMARAGA